MGRSLLLHASITLGVVGLGGCTALLGLESPRLVDASATDEDAPRVDAARPDAVGSTACPSTYTQVTFGGTYRFVPTTASWDTAAADCANDTTAGGTKHTHLIVLSSAMEENAASAFSGQVDVWLGLTDRVTEGSYLWMTTEAVNYPPSSGTPWAVGEPAGGIAADCIHMDVYAEFYEASCADGRKYICECDDFPADPARY